MSELELRGERMEQHSNSTKESSPISEFSIDDADLIFQLSGDSLREWLFSSEKNLGISNSPELSRFVKWDSKGWISNLSVNSREDEPNSPWYGNIFGHRNLPEFRVKFDQMALRLSWHPVFAGELGDRTRRLGVRAFPLDRRGNRLRGRDPWVIPFLAHESESFTSQTVWLPSADREVHGIRLDLRTSERFSWNLASIEVFAFSSDSSFPLIKDATRRDSLSLGVPMETLSQIRAFDSVDSIRQESDITVALLPETEYIGLLVWWNTTSSKGDQQMWWAKRGMEIKWFGRDGGEIANSRTPIPIWGKFDANSQFSIIDAIKIPSEASEAVISPILKIFETIEFEKIDILQSRRRESSSEFLSYEFSTFSQRMTGEDKIVFELGGDSLRELVSEHSENLQFSSCVSWDDSGFATFGASERSWYFEGLIGTKSLPWCKIDGPLVDIEVNWKGIPRSGKNQFQQMLRFFWGDEKGRILPGVEKQAIPMLGDNHENWKFDSFRGIPVHLKAKSMIIDPCIPNQSRKGTILFRSMTIKQPIIKEEVTVLDGYNHQNPLELGEIHFHPDLKEGEKPLVNSGLRLNVTGFSALRGWDSKYAVEEIPVNELFMAGKFENQTIRAIRPDNVATEFRPTPCDLVSVDQDGRNATIEWSIWNVAERQLTCIVDGKEGQRYSRNRALDRPPSKIPGLTLTIREIGHNSSFVSISNNPNGSESTIIFTEHADQQTVLTERLVMFGNTKGEFVKGKGWLGNGLPLTKTVFATGFRSGRDSWNKKRLTSLDHPEFRKLIYNYSIDWADLVELGLHTFSSGPINSDVGTSILQEFNDLNLKVWIDHGRQKNPTSLTRHGMETEDENYFIASELSESGINTLWSYRDSRTGELNTISRRAPSNLIFSLPIDIGNSREIWTPSWFSTTRINFHEETMTDDDLEKLCLNNGVCLAHVYLSVNLHGHLTPGPEKELDIHDSWFEEGAPVSLSPWFEEMLQRLSRWRDSGRINISTIGEWASFANQISNVGIEQTKGKAILKNDSGKKIKGFSIAIVGDASDFSINGAVIPNSREGDGLHILWWDLANGKSELLWNEKT